MGHINSERHKESYLLRLANITGGQDGLTGRGLCIGITNESLGRIWLAVPFLSKQKNIFLQFIYLRTQHFSVNNHVNKNVTYGK